jgi:hypothetical protein
VVDAPGNYTLTVTNPENGCSATDIACVKGNGNQPEVEIVCSGIFTCREDSIQLFAVSTIMDVSYLWTGPEGFRSSKQNPFVTKPGTYTVTVRTLGECIASASILVTDEREFPQCMLTAPAGVTCNSKGNTIMVEYIAGHTYEWKLIASKTGWNIVSGQGTNTMTFDAGECGEPVTIRLTVTNSAGCSATCEITFEPTEHRPPCPLTCNANAGPDRVIGPGSASIVLNGYTNATGATYLWTASDGGHIVSGENTLHPVIDAPGTYTFSVNSHVCQKSDVAIVTSYFNQPSDGISASPNPFSLNTTFEFSVRKAGYATVELYNLSGMKVATVFSGTIEADKPYQVNYSAENLNSGTYVYKLITSEKIYFNKIQIVR